MQQPAYKDYYNLYNNKLPIAEYLGTNGMYIGIHQYLSQEDLDYVIEVFEKIF
jgi:CDP-6-deoxy-D-xylo-4-hexulose-3-dehydrase